MVFIIIGTTAEYIKTFPVMERFRKNKLPYKLILTGQHPEINEGIRIKSPDYLLSSKNKNSENVSQLFFWFFEVLFNSRKLPIGKKDYVIIQGDAISAFIGFLIGKFFKARIVHVESGKRTFNFLNPFPEEIIRTIISACSDVHFADYAKEAKNLQGRKEVYTINGNTIFDSVNAIVKFKPSSKIKELANKKYVLFMAHRQENILLKKNLNKIIEILEMVLKRGFSVIWFMHTPTNYELKVKKLWPKVFELRNKYKLSISPLFNYVDFIHAVKLSQFVISDSGGLQDEAYVLNKPIMILRKEAENSGIGETAYISSLDKKKAEYFLNHYQSFKRKTALSSSPSDKIADYFKKNVKN